MIVCIDDKKDKNSNTMEEKSRLTDICENQEKLLYVAGKTRVTELLFYNSRTDTEVNIKFVPRSDCYCTIVKRFDCNIVSRG